MVVVLVEQQIFSKRRLFFFIPAFYVYIKQKAIPFLRPMVTILNRRDFIGAKLFGENKITAFDCVLDCDTSYSIKL